MNRTVQALINTRWLTKKTLRPAKHNTQVAYASPSKALRHSQLANQKLWCRAIQDVHILQNMGRILAFYINKYDSIYLLKGEFILQVVYLYKVNGQMYTDDSLKSYFYLSWPLIQSIVL